MTNRFAHLSIFAAIGVGLAVPAVAVQPINLEDSFRIGSGGSVLCRAQVMGADPALTDMFDRGYSIVCRDASAPVGQIYALRARTGDRAASLGQIRAERARCAPGPRATIKDLGSVETLNCRLKDADVAYKVYLVRRGGTVFAAEGLAGYDSALQLGLRSVVTNKPVEGEVAVATTGAGDPASFARVQAGNISPQRALAEAYRRNNAGNYADAAEFFASLARTDADRGTMGEALVNQALQRSNLGATAEADRLFARVDQLVDGDPVLARQLRNYRAMHLLNQGKAEPALAQLARPLDASVRDPGRSLTDLVIDKGIAAQLSAETPAARRLGGSEGLSPQDKAHILDAQALQLRGSTLRLLGRNQEAAAALSQAESQLVAVRSGRVAATGWMRAQILAELADLAERSGNLPQAATYHETAIQTLTERYPGSSALLSARGKQAAFYARTGQTAPALTVYREIVEASIQSGTPSPALRRVLQPYFGLLIGPARSAESSAEMFRASQLLVRPSVAQTQAVLARELSGGSDEAARLFRQTVNLTREVERMRVELARLQSTQPQPDAARIEAVKGNLERAQAEQVALQAKLGEYPRYRVVSNTTVGAKELQATLKPGEAYYKMVVLGDDAYAMLVTPDGVEAFRIATKAAELEQQVQLLRDTIIDEAGDTLAFDLAVSHQLYRSLFDPISAQLAQVRHLIFEPDGAMMRLPPNLLVMDKASIDRYAERVKQPGGDPFDFTGTAWLGKDRNISTAVSAQAFRDVRQAPPSRAKSHYIGFGENQPAAALALGGNNLRQATAGSDCEWPLAAWNRPISASELVTARQLVGTFAGAAPEVVTGPAFNDEAIRARDDLDEYRIVHFATHGLLAPPRRSCPAQPALMTSFGGQQSDGLLSFREIFDLRLDADIVILSACDTAGQSSLAANLEAGVSGRGEAPLDGLVRAFVAAGGRLVVASHWPVPDDYNATERLISGMFEAPPGSGTAEALRSAQLKLMSTAETSHPFYWASFAVVGDGVVPVIPASATSAAK